MQKLPLFPLCIPPPRAGVHEWKSTLITGICWSGLLQAELEWDSGAPSPPVPFAAFLGCMEQGKVKPRPRQALWPRGSRQAGIHPRCPGAKSAAAAPAALAPRSQLFPPPAPDVSHYPNCNQPGSACFPDWGLAVFVGLLPPAREGKGREGPALLTATAAPARALTCPTDGIWPRLSCLRQDAGLAARVPGKRGFCCLIPAAPGAAAPWGDSVGGSYS